MLVSQMSGNRIFATVPIISDNLDAISFTCFFFRGNPANSSRKGKIHGYRLTKGDYHPVHNLIEDHLPLAMHEPASNLPLAIENSAIGGIVVECTNGLASYYR